MNHHFLTLFTLLFTFTHLSAQNYLWQQSEQEKAVFKKNQVKLRIGVYSSKKITAPDSAFSAYYDREGQLIKKVTFDGMMGFTTDLHNYANGKLEQVATFGFPNETNLQSKLFDMPFVKLHSQFAQFFAYSDDSVHIEEYSWNKEPDFFAKYQYKIGELTGKIPLSRLQDNKTTIDKLYYQNGKIVKMIHDTADSTIYSYNELGLLKNKSMFRRGYVYQTSYEFNDLGLPIKEIISWKGEITSIMDYSYVFYENEEESYSYLWAPFEKPKIVQAPKAPELYTVEEARPQIIGGLKELYKHVVYSKKSMKKGIEGKVIVEFTVDEKGNTTDFNILQNPGGDLGKSVINAIKKVKFTPGIQRGRPVKVRYTLPVTFSLSPK